MARIDSSDIVAYYVEGCVVSPEHITDEELANIGQDDIILESDVNDEEFIFCDRSGERIR